MSLASYGVAIAFALHVLLELLLVVRSTRFFTGGSEVHESESQAAPVPRGPCGGIMPAFPLRTRTPMRILLKNLRPVGYGKSKTSASMFS